MIRQKSFLLVALGLGLLAGCLPIGATASKSHSKHVIHQQSTGDVIEDYIRQVQPHKSSAYAHRVAVAIHRASAKTGVPAIVIAATAKIESNFIMCPRPCIGIMQMHPRTFQREYGDSGLNLWNLEQNILLGAMELKNCNYPESVRSRKIAVLASRSFSSSRMGRMWGRYNGAGPHSGYVRLVSGICNRLKSGHIRKKISE